MDESEVVYDDEYRGNIERITIQDGWMGFSDGYFCIVERNGICVEDFGTTRRSALRYARRAWKKEKNEKTHKERGYPKVKECS